MSAYRTAERLRISGNDRRARGWIIVIATVVATIAIASTARAQFTVPNIHTDNKRSAERPAPRPGAYGPDSAATARMLRVVGISGEIVRLQRAATTPAERAAVQPRIDSLERLRNAVFAEALGPAAGDSVAGGGDGVDDVPVSSPTQPELPTPTLNESIRRLTDLMDATRSGLALEERQRIAQIVSATPERAAQLQREVDSLRALLRDSIATLEARRQYVRSVADRADERDGFWLPFTSALGSRLFYEDSAFTELVKAVTRSQIGATTNADAPTTYSLYSEVASAFIGPVRLTLGTLLNSQVETTKTDSLGELVIDSTRVHLNALNELLNGGGNALLKFELPLLHLGGEEFMLRTSTSGNVAGSLPKAGAIDPREGAFTGRVGAEIYGLYADHASNFALYVVARLNGVWAPDAARVSLGVSAAESIAYMHFLAGVAIMQRVHVNLSFYSDLGGNLGRTPITLAVTIVPE